MENEAKVRIDGNSWSFFHCAAAAAVVVVSVEEVGAEEVALFLQCVTRCQSYLDDVSFYAFDVDSFELLSMRNQLVNVDSDHSYLIVASLILMNDYSLIASIQCFHYKLVARRFSVLRLALLLRRL